MSAALTEPVQTGTLVPVLSVNERAALLECEAIVRHGLKAFVEVGHALAKIRDSKLYRETFGTFEDYCLATWDITDRYARNLWSAAEVVDELAKHNFAVLPETESQARPLTKLPQVEWVPTWVEVLADGQEKVTASRVAMVVQRRMSRLKGNRPASDTDLFKRPVTIDAGTREEQILATTASARAELRKLQDLIRTADSEAAANVARSIQDMDKLQDHVQRVNGLHANRKGEA